MIAEGKIAERRIAEGKRIAARIRIAEGELLTGNCQRGIAKEGLIELIGSL
jgi:hypothetical protein